MISESNDILIESERDACERDAGLRAAPVYGALPAEVVVTERAAAALRAYLGANGLAHYRVFFSSDTIHDVEKHLDALGEVAAWEPVPAMVEGGQVIHAVTQNSVTGAGRMWESGILRLARAEVVLGRWYWANREGYYARSLWLMAAPSAEHYAKLRTGVLEQRRLRADAVWQVVHDSDEDQDTRTPRDAAAIDEILIAPALRSRLDGEVVGFFRDDVAALYRALKVPYRRGVLLHGPPGNGKTSLIRYVGARLMHIPAMLLRPAAKFNTDDLEDVLRRWRKQAPAILVIEDLDWLVRQTNVSTLLNLLDGVDSAGGADGRGLLLIATTNNPQDLDPAINNRPGRFDVVIEIDRPDRSLRLELLRRKLPDTDDAARQRVADATDGLSFAQVLEVLRLSGFTAIAAGRAQRTDSDLLDAAATVSATNDDARRGFPIKPDAPFGLSRRRE